MNFKVMGNDIKFSDEFIELNKIRVQFLNLSFESGNDFDEKIREKFKTFDELLKEGEAFACEFLDSYIVKALETLKEYEVTSINKDEFKNKYYYGKYCTWFKEFDKKNEEYLLSKDSEFDIKTLKQEIKERRSDWIIAKGKEFKKLKANMEVASSKVNSKLINNGEFVKIKEAVMLEEGKKEETIYLNEVLNTLTIAMQQSVFNIHLSILDVLKEKEIKKVVYYSDFIKAEKANEILGNITNKDIEKGNKDEEKEDTRIKEVIELNPYNEEIYKLLLIKFGDKENEIVEIAKFLGYNNIESYKIELVEKYYEELSTETKEQVNESKEKLIIYADNLNIKDYDKWIEKLDEKIKVDVLDELMNKYYALDKNGRRKVCAIAVAICVVVAYLVITMHFNNRFYYGTVIDNVDVVGKNVEEVTEELAKKVESYKLEVELIDDSKVGINSSDIDLNYDLKEEVEKVKNEQNPFQWISGIFNKSEYNLADGVTYNEDKLNEIIDKLPCFDEEKVVAPKNAELEYKDGKYEIVKEVEGNTIKADMLKESIINAIKGKEKILNLDESQCYEKPKYTSESEEVINAKTELDKYVSTTIDYNVDGNKEVINGEIINNWLEVDEDFILKFNEEEVGKYLGTLGAKYDKADNIREFGGKKFTTSKEIITIDREEETKALIELVKTGEAKEREAKFTTTAVGGNIINTFAEIDITKQHIWFYKDGELLTDGPVVTGNISKGHNTRVGVFKLYGKQRNTVLRGDDYAVPVDFWMPFDGGIGMHDAGWRGQFGGEIYKTNGSHGCVNSVYDVAKTIYNNIKIGDYVVVHY